jgi:CRISPR-associated protein Cmr2
MSSYLFTLTITPVQSFITQARKTKDLFAGSKILSSIIRNTIKKAEDEYNAKLIFPQDNDHNAKRIFPQDIEFVSNKFVLKLEDKDPKVLGDDLEKFINKESINLIFKKTNKCDTVFYNFFQVFWVAVKLTDDYKKDYKKLEHSLGAVKNLRTFTQKLQQKGKEKCSICGERNWEEKESEDKLCLICYTKRVCGRDEIDSSFQSTADIVMLNRKDSLNGKIAQKYLEDNPSEKKYYALIHLDIDSLGKTLSNLDEEGQIKLSKALANFSEEAKDTVDKAGKTIYAGGDDFLGFVNLSYLFDVIIDIQKAFEETVKKEFSNLTYSTSIIIAHYKAPLHKVLDYSRELLAQTKNHFDDKNGVGIIVMSNSAINAQTICRYDDLPLLKEMRNKKIGMNLHYKLNSVFNFLDDTSMGYKEEYAYQMGMLEIEIKRLLKREQIDFSFDIYRKLIDFLHQQVDGLDTETKITIDFDNFIGYLKTLEQLKKVM